MYTESCACRFRRLPSKLYVVFKLVVRSRSRCAAGHFRVKAHPVSRIYFLSDFLPISFTYSKKKTTPPTTMASPNNGPQDSRSACEKVFGIAELADQILLDLPMQNILSGTQQVCRRWQTAIECSDLVQEHLFMKPICDKRLLMGDDMTKQRHWVEKETPEKSRTVLENPFLSLLCHENVCIKDQAFVYPQASWRKMLVTQPPVRKVKA